MKLIIKTFKNLKIPILVALILMNLIPPATTLFIGKEAQAAAVSDSDLKSIMAETTFYDPDSCATSGTNLDANNGSVYAIGDSILENANKFGGLKKALTNKGYDKNNITVDAIIGRAINTPGQETDGRAPISAYDSASNNIDKISSAGTIIVVLGTNGDSYNTAIPKLMDLIRPKNPNAKIFWVNVGVRNPTGGMTSANNAISKFSTNYKYTVIDWAKEVKSNPGYVPLSPNGDGIHPGSDGSKALVNLIVTAAGQYSKSSGDQTIAPDSGANSDYEKVAAEVLGKDWLKTQMTKIEKNRPTYEQAAKEVGIPWQLLAVIHYNEHGLAVDNPSNGQGIYQFYEEAGQYPPGPVSQQEFLKQTIHAAKLLKGKPHGKDLKLSGTSDSTIKWVLVEYNGVASFYAEQAKRLGFTEPYDGSPYVMNFADDKRNPKKNPQWQQFTCDGDCLKTANTSFIGAWLFYAIIGGSSSASSSSCVSDATPNGAGEFGWDLKNMVFFSQCDPKWANKPYGGSGTICASGCGLTSIAMSIATLTGNKSLTPALFATKYGDYHIAGSGTSWELLSKAAKDYDLKSNDIGMDFAAVKETLKKGGLVLATFGPGAFTSQGHFMVIHAFSPDGTKYFIADPYNGNHNGSYTAEYITTKGNLTKMWSYTK